MKPPSLTIGIEEEYQIVDPQTRELRSYITQILEEGKLLLREQVKPELHQAMVEVGSEVCRTPAELREELVRHVLCLSTSSPFWMGRTTGLKSYRSIIFRNFPRSGIPRVFQSWEDFSYLVDTLVRTKTIPDGTKIWWDARPNWSYPTLEFRVCDVCTRVDEAICVAAIFQAIVAKL